MATYTKGQSISLVAAAALTAKQFYAVKIDSNGKAALAGAGEAAIGIVQNNPGAGQPASVMVSGSSKAVAGGSITAGDVVAANADGKLVAATKGRTNTADEGGATDALLGSNVIGIALTGASSNDIFTVAIMHMGAVPTTAS
jgi:hypothetical protein